MLPWALFFLLALPAGAQFADLTAPGHGDDLYYALSVQQPIADFWTHSSSNSPIYKVGTVPPTLFLSFPAPVFPPNGPYLTGEPWYVSSYYLVSHPSFSQNGTVFAYTGKRVCLGGQGCVNVSTTQTTVEGVPGRGTLTFEGTGSLSRNGRYLLILPDTSPATSSQPTWIDLQTTQQQSLPIPDRTISFSMSGRVLAEDGTAVLTGCSPPGSGLGAGDLCVFRGGQLISASTEPAMEPVIDSAGQTVVYTSVTKSPNPQRSLRVYRIATRQDSVFEQPNGDTYSPSISSDGKRVMFLSAAQWGTTNPPGTTQLYTINLDGSGFQELTSGTEPTGVQEYTMSDDGQVAWYVAGDGKLVKLDLSSGQPVRTVFRPAAVDLSTALVPGSAITWNAAGINDATITMGGIPAPLLSVAPNNITVQVPWEIRSEQPVAIQVVTNAGTPTEASVQATVSVAASRPALLPVQGCTMPGFCDLGGAPIHQDWSAYVSPDHPAQPGEVLHFFGTGFGAVQPTPATGNPAPANPLALLPNPPVCASDPGGPAAIMYLGLAPGLIGYYQMDVQMPPAFSTVHPTENRPYDQLYIDCGPGVVAIFAIQTKSP